MHQTSKAELHSLLNTSKRDSSSLGMVVPVAVVHDECSQLQAANFRLPPSTYQSTANPTEPLILSDYCQLQATSSAIATSDVIAVTSSDDDDDLSLHDDATMKTYRCTRIHISFANAARTVAIDPPRGNWVGTNAGNASGNTNIDIVVNQFGHLRFSKCCTALHPPLDGIVY